MDDVRRKAGWKTHFFRPILHYTQVLVQTTFSRDHTATAPPQARMPPHPRLNEDVDMAEEAELRRLEEGADAPESRPRKAARGKQPAELHESEQAAGLLVSSLVPEAFFLSLSFFSLPWSPTIPTPPLHSESLQPPPP